MTTVVEPKSSTDIVRLLGIGVLSVGLNYLIFGKLLKQSQKQQPRQPRKLKKELMSQIINHERTQIDLLSSNKQLKSFKKDQDWGSVKLLNELNQDPLLKELKLLDSLLCEVSRVNHMIVDLQLSEFKPYPNRLMATKIKYEKQEPFLNKQAFVTPGQFVIKQAKFIPGVTLELEKKYMRAGPRGSQFFRPEQVRADIVCLGGVCPGMNTVIRQITTMLKQVYQVISVTGVRNGFNGYYDRKFVDLNPQIVETSHHYGGCFLGLCQTEFHLNKIIESLVERKINQVYLIGANKTMRACHAIHKQIRKRRLPIAICVLLKGINRDVPIFDSCFGFETAVEQSSKIVQKAYAFCHSYQNGISLVKLPGYSSGFLASYTVLSTINANICLVPQFQFDMFGQHGLLAAIVWRLKNKGSCTIIYSEGCQNSLRDCCIKKSSKQQTITEFDNFLQHKIEQAMKQQNIIPFQIGVFNSIYASRSAPANSIDTKLCCQIAQGSVMGVMAGYTNFAVGHLANKSTMISIDELIHSQSVTQLRENDDLWQQTIMTTGQPSLKNERFQLKSPETFLKHFMRAGYEPPQQR